MSILKIHLQAFPKNIFLFIPISFVIAFLVWFFGGVVFQLNLPTFTYMWGRIYMGMMVLLIALSVIQFTIQVIYFTRLARKLTVSVADITEAIMVIKLHKEKPVGEWETDWFKRELEIWRVTKKISNSVFESLRKRY